MQVIYKYKILIVFATLIGQAFLFSLGFTAWQGLEKSIHSEEYEHHGNRLKMNKNEIHTYPADTLKIRSMDFEEPNSNLMHKENISIDF